MENGIILCGSGVQLGLDSFSQEVFSSSTRFRFRGEHWRLNQQQMKKKKKMSSGVMVVVVVAGYYTFMQTQQSSGM